MPAHATRPDKLSPQGSYVLFFGFALAYPASSVTYAMNHGTFSGRDQTVHPIRVTCPTVQFGCKNAPATARRQPPSHGGTMEVLACAYHVSAEPDGAILLHPQLTARQRLGLE